MPCPVTGEPNCRCDMSRKTKTSLVSPKETLRKLFTDHVVFTKLFITSSLEDTGDVKAVASRLFENQDDIGEYVGTFVGKGKGKRLAVLLREHITLAAGCVGKLKEGDTAGLHREIERLMKNAEEVSRHIHSLNPDKLPLKLVTEEFKKHNTHVLDIAVSHSKKQYSTEIRQYDMYYNHMLMFSDTLYAAL